MQLLLELVDGLLHLVDLLRDRPRRLVPELVMVHPVVMLIQPVAAGRALNDTIVLVVRNVLLNVVVLAMAAQTHIDDLNGVIVHEDVDVEDEAAQLEQVVGAQVEVDLRPAAEMRVLDEGQVVLHLAHIELLESLDHVAASHLVSDLGEHFMDVVVPLLLGHLVKRRALVPQLVPIESEGDNHDIVVMVMVVHMIVIVIGGGRLA